MGRERFSVALFGTSDGGTRLIERTSDPDLVAHVRNELLAQRRADVERLEGDDEAPPPLRVVRPAVPPSEEDDG